MGAEPAARPVRGAGRAGLVRRAAVPLRRGVRPRDPHTFAFDAAGDLWFTVQNGNFVGKFGVETGEVRLVEMPNNPSRPGSSTRPYGLKMDSKDRPWATLFGTNQLVMVDPETETVWFGTDVNTIGRAVLPPLRRVSD